VDDGSQFGRLLRSERTTEQRPADLVFGEEDNFLPPGSMVEVSSPHIVLEIDGGEAMDALVFASYCLGKRSDDPSAVCHRHRGQR
jgi:hypothetical protein